MFPTRWTYFVALLPSLTVISYVILMQSPAYGRKEEEALWWWIPFRSTRIDGSRWDWWDSENEWGSGTNWGQPSTIEPGKKRYLSCRLSILSRWSMEGKTTWEWRLWSNPFFSSTEEVFTITSSLMQCQSCILCKISFLIFQIQRSPFGAAADLADRELSVKF